jgi:hypothetical protein
MVSDLFFACLLSIGNLAISEKKFLILDLRRFLFYIVPDEANQKIN